jgi:transcriptional regulator with XRE-family HTH domain
VAKPYGKVMDREREICARVKPIRKSIKWSQSSFAQALGISRDRLANIECGRTPLRSSIAIRLSILSGFSLKWIAEGIEPQKLRLTLGESLLSEIPGNCLFSEAWKHWIKQPFETASKEAKAWINARPGDASHTDAPETVGDQAEIGFNQANDVLSYLTEDFRGVLKKIPPHLLGGFYALITNACRDFVAINIVEICEWEARLQNISEKNLRRVSLKRKDEGVKSEVQKLIEQVRRKASKPGAKSNLARELHVAPARISEWLSGEKEPGGDYALRLKNWVKTPEPQK